MFVDCSSTPLHRSSGAVPTPELLFRLARRFWFPCRAHTLSLDSGSPTKFTRGRRGRFKCASHSLWWTEELFRDMGREAFAGVIEVSQGTAPKNVVNPKFSACPAFSASSSGSVRQLRSGVRCQPDEAEAAGRTCSLYVEHGRGLCQRSHSRTLKPHIFVELIPRYCSFSVLGIRRS